MKTLASRMNCLAPHFFATLGPQIAAMQSRGLDVIRLDEGSPDLPPPAAVIDALQQGAADPGRHSYQSHRGTPALRQAWAGMYRRVHGVDLDSATQVVPLLGTKEGIFHLSQALLDPGDVALIPDPGYITYTRGALFAGAEPYYLPLYRENGYLPDLAAIPSAILRRAKILWLNYPNNPTAALAAPEFFAEAVAFGRRHDILVCHDAAYAQVTFDGRPAPSILEVEGAADVAVEFNSLSKAANMAGWRVGAVVGNRPALDALYTLKTNVDSSHFLPVLEAAAVALAGDDDWLAARNAIYRQRRDVLVAGLNALGLPAALPGGSLYVWCPTPPGWRSEDFVRLALEQAHVSLTPGTLFGAQGEGALRIAITAPHERLSLAIERLAATTELW